MTDHLSKEAFKAGATSDVEPSIPTDLATKNYVDTKVSSIPTATASEADIVPGSGWAHYGTTLGNVKLTRLGSLVIIQGVIKRTADIAVTAQTYMPFGTIPVGFRPDAQVDGTSYHSSNITIARLRIMTDGVANIAFTFTGTAATNTWFPVNLVWRAA